MIHTLKNEMERMWNQFDHKAFISNDPIQIVHQIRNLGELQRILRFVQYGRLWFHGDNIVI